MIFCLSLIDDPDEKELFTGLYTRYRQLLWYAANEILHDEQLAEDAVQEAYISVIAHLNSIDSPLSPRTKKYLVTVVRNKAIDIYRQRSTRMEKPLDDEIDISSGEDLLEQYMENESTAYIHECIRKLPPRDRVILEYRYLFDMSEKEVAAVMELPPKHVNVLIFRARRKLQQLISGA